MDTRRDFLKKAALLASAGALPASIQRAFAIDPEPGTTWQDAEHVVILMQENRSFDHCYGTLQGVRGFNDPRAVSLPNGHPVWLQTNAQGETYAPFHLDIKETKTTWMGCLPHSWADQVDAFNRGKHDHWLESKRSGNKDYAEMPLTMGYHTREDVPFYYSLADAFTVCDQHFCSSLTGTMPNRLYLWSGTVRGTRDASAPAKVLNSDVEYDNSASWTTFPERLEDHGVSWKIYQNELYLEVGFTAEEAPWLSNFGDNPLEWFTQYHAKFAHGHLNYLNKMLATLPAEIEELKRKLTALAPGDPAATLLKGQVDKAEKLLANCVTARAKWSPENFEKLSEREKQIHLKALSTNAGDSHYHELTTLKYRDGDVERELKVPKGDVLHQFRQDVEKGQLPAVSWIVAPQNFSDHPDSAWFGAWYLSETIDILTRNPKVWKKTIFMLTYDENDGYFDHVPPFVAPHPRKLETGATSPGLSVEEDYVTMEQELKVKKQAAHARESSIGLGFRVPMVIASPWSRGGYVCSQVFDHTSVLQFLEKFASRKAGRPVVESNISDWRRVVCGDLTSAFRPFNGQPIPLPKFVEREPFLEGIHRAQFKKAPSTYHALSREEIQRIMADRRSSPQMPRQEPGTRPSCALPYQLRAEGKLDSDGKSFELVLEAGNQVFGPRSAGSAFSVRAPGRYRAGASGWEQSRHWAFAVAAGSRVRYGWPLADFEGGTYHLQVHGPNGFFRELQGTSQDPLLDVEFDYERDGASVTGRIELRVSNRNPHQPLKLSIQDQSYQAGIRREEIPANSQRRILLETKSSSGWYDFAVSVEGSNDFGRRYAGRVETGKDSLTDPAMGSV